MSEQRNSFLTVLAVVIVGAAILLSWQVASDYRQKRAAEQLTQEAKRKAEILKAFPAELALDPQAEASYSDVQETREGQLWRKGFTSQLAADELLARYQEYLKQEGWIELLQSATPAGEAVLSYLKDQSRLGVTIAADGAGSKLNLDYYKRLKIFDQGRP